MEAYLIIITIATLLLCLVLFLRLRSIHRNILAMPFAVAATIHEAEKQKALELLNNPENTDEEIEEMYGNYISVLKQHGCSPDVLEHGVVFDYQGFRWILRRNIDALKVRFELPGIMQVSATDPKLPKIIEVCNEAARNLWGVQIFWVVGDKDDDDKERTYHFFIASDAVLVKEGAEAAIRTSLEAVMSAYSQLRYDMTRLRDEETTEGPLWSAQGSQFPPANLN